MTARPYPEGRRALAWRFGVLALCAGMTLACGEAGGGNGAARDDAARRAVMVTSQIAARGVRNPHVLRAMGTVPRHEFVPDEIRPHAYEDRALPIGDGQTISQPYMVAVMTELAGSGPGRRVLEIGTGSGYQAAILAETGAEVWSVEIVEPLHVRAAETLRRLGYERVHLRLGDGRRGWPEEAPFDAIVVTAAAEAVPPALLEQLGDGGTLVIPVGPDWDQTLEVHRRSGDRVTVERTFGVRFVPLVRGR